MLSKNMAARILQVSLLPRSLLRPVTWRFSVIFKLRKAHTLSFNRINVYHGRNWLIQRCFSSGEVASDLVSSVPHEEGCRKIMIVQRRGDKNVPPIYEQDLLDYFSPYGEIEGLRWVRDRETKASKGYGFVNFSSKTSAETVVSKKLHHLAGGEVAVFLSSDRKASAAKERRKILLLPRETNVDAKGFEVASVKDYFSAFGEVEHVSGAVDKKTAAPRGFMFVTFKNPNSVENVLLHESHEIDGRPVRVVLAEENQRQTKRKMPTTPHQEEGKRIVVTTRTTDQKCINEGNLAEYFSAYGEIGHTLVVRNRTTMASKGIGFVTFKEAKTVDNVLENANHKIGGRNVLVRKAITSEEKWRKVYVSNVSQELTKQDVFDHFSTFGEVLKVVFPKQFGEEDMTVSCSVIFRDVESATRALEMDHHKVSSQEDELVVKSVMEHSTQTKAANKLLVENISEDMTVDTLRGYFEGFGAIQHVGLITQPSEEKSNFSAASVAFLEDSSVKKALSTLHHNIDGCEVSVKKATSKLLGKHLDFRSLKVAINQLPPDVDGDIVREYLKSRSCRVRSVTFLPAPTSACIVSFWNLSDVDRLMKQASSSGHVVGGREVLIRRIHWDRSQDEGLQELTDSSSSDDDA